MTKLEVLRATTFGKRIAEEEEDELKSYFVETEQWRSIFKGEVDVIYGPKGAGKSAIYSLLLGNKDELFDQSIMAIGAENPRGAPVFKDLVTDPPASEDEFRGLWKLYFLSLVANHLREYGIAPDVAGKVIQPLEEAGLLERGITLKGLLKSVLDYVRRVVKAESIEGGVNIDPISGQPTGFTGKIKLQEPSANERDLGFVSADTLLMYANIALETANYDVWLLLDRLDVAFAETGELERNGLRALFRVYLDLLAHSRISLKIFLRSDIWRRITEGGFREASHITRHVTISWTSKSLLNLIVRRALHNEAIREMYNVDVEDVLRDTKKQSELFYRIFPDQVDAGTRKPTTLDWILSRTSDGSKLTAPREVIHLLSSARNNQLEEFELGVVVPPEEAIFSRTSLKTALPEVSRVRYEQTLCAEYPQFKPVLQKLEGEKTQQTPETLSTVWAITRDEALETANKLVEIGFFEKRGSKEEPFFWIPFLYRDALQLIQGAAEERETEGEPQAPSEDESTSNASEVSSEELDRGINGNRKVAASDS